MPLTRYTLKTAVELDAGDVARLPDGGEWIVLDGSPVHGYTVEAAMWGDRYRERRHIRDDFEMQPVPTR